MNKAKPTDDEMPAAYTRADLGPLVRGKYAARYAKASNGVVIDSAMKPLADWPLPQRRQLIGVFTDIDDTLTCDGAITADALQALADLTAAGLTVIAITGRSIGWCQPFAQGDTAWPVAAMVAENGAVAFARVATDEKALQPRQHHRDMLSKLYLQPADVRQRNQLALQTVAAQILHELPQARLSHDGPQRETDIAIDHSEFNHLNADDIARVVAIMQAAGLSATVSSIHINGWFGSHNKLAGARWIVQQLWGRDLTAELDQWAYVGDSTNDQVMFEHFAHSIGVANIRRFAAELRHLPRYITQGERGAGFAEVARAILWARMG